MVKKHCSKYIIICHDVFQYRLARWGMNAFVPDTAEPRNPSRTMVWSMMLSEESMEAETCLCWDSGRGPVWYHGHAIVFFP